MHNKYCSVTYQMLNTFDKYLLKAENLNSRPDTSELKECSNKLLPLLHVEKDNTSENNVDSDDYFSPRIEDSLFWCVYIHMNGIEEYLMIQFKYKNKEIYLKMQIVKCLSENLFPKSMKIAKKVQQEIIGSLMTNKKTDIHSIYGLCVYYKLHLLIVHEKSKTSIKYNDEQENTCVNTCVIYRNNLLRSGASCKYKVDLNVTESKNFDIKNNFVKSESFEKI